MRKALSQSVSYVDQTRRLRPGGVEVGNKPGRCKSDKIYAKGCGMRRSYCDDCVHAQVCKFRKEVQAYEAKAPQMISTVTGPIVTYSIRCQCKNTEADYRK